MSFCWCKELPGLISSFPVIIICKLQSCRLWVFFISVTWSLTFAISSDNWTSSTLVPSLLPLSVHFPGLQYLLCNVETMLVCRISGAVWYLSPADQSKVWYVQIPEGPPYHSNHSPCRWRRFYTLTRWFKVRCNYHTEHIRNVIWWLRNLLGPSFQEIKTVK